jgi:hypothetical protein
MKKNLSDTPNVLIELENGILIATLKNSFVDIEIVKEMLHERINVSQGKKYPLLVKMKSLSKITGDARAFLGSSKGYEGVTIFAIQVESSVGKMIASMFLFLNPPLVPTKIFTDEAKAKEWLLQFK